MTAFVLVCEKQHVVITYCLPILRSLNLFYHTPVGAGARSARFAFWRFQLKSWFSFK